MNLVNNYNDLSKVFNKYNISTIDFTTKLTIVIPENVDTILQNIENKNTVSIITKD